MAYALWHRHDQFHAKCTCQGLNGVYYDVLSDVLDNILEHAFRVVHKLNNLLERILAVGGVEISAFLFLSFRVIILKTEPHVQLFDLRRGLAHLIDKDIEEIFSAFEELLFFVFVVLDRNLYQ